MNIHARAAGITTPPSGDGDAPAPDIILDLSRLLSRVLHTTPTGIDRVEMAYARELLRRLPGQLRFAAVHPIAGYGRLPTQDVLRFLDETENLWAGRERRDRIGLRIAAARKLWALRPQPAPKVEATGANVYLQASPNNLTKPDLIAKILKREQARFVCLVHDLIPIQYPEYARPGGADQHRKRMDTLGSHAATLVTNSGATRDILADYLGAQGRVPPIHVAHLGTAMPDSGRKGSPIDIPYFVCVGTIEPRKNHLLLLNLWRRMAERAVPGQLVPKLVLVGRRGWENENVVDMLDRCPELSGHVIEASRMPDGDVEDLIAGARALLLPSFAEGYGMPVAEALAMGVPVLCSDLAAHREVGGSAPEYLDPLDGPGWLVAIEDYTGADSVRRKLQQQRMRRWRAPNWEDHLSIVLNACAQAARQPV
jgi:glycosyltransferase involved in cell wall biosynthesis